MDNGSIPTILAFCGLWWLVIWVRLSSNVFSWNQAYWAMPAYGRKHTQEGKSVGKRNALLEDMLEVENSWIITHQVVSLGINNDFTEGWEVKKAMVPDWIRHQQLHLLHKVERLFLCPRKHGLDTIWSWTQQAINGMFVIGGVGNANPNNIVENHWVLVCKLVYCLRCYWRHYEDKLHTSSIINANVFLERIKPANVRHCVIAWRTKVTSSSLQQ